MAHPDYLLLEEMFAKHRQTAFVTCDEKCFCWEIEKWLFIEAAQQSVQPTGGSLPQSEPLLSVEQGTGIEYLKRQPTSG